MRIAIVGTGVSGIGAAHALHRVHDVEVLERGARAGGHSDTVMVLRSRRTARLLAEIARFMATARRHLDGRHRTRSVADFVREEGYSADFRDHFLVPLTSAIRSTAPGDAARFPMDDALRFFDAHNLLGFRRHTWRTIVGGSRMYVRAALQPLGDHVHLGCGVRALRREGAGVVLETDDGRERPFDAAVVATHSDHALAMLADPTPDEVAVLGARGAV